MKAVRLELMIAVLMAAPPTLTVRFVDKAAEAGLKDVFYCGGSVGKKYIIETLGTGLALLDYDRDGYPDLFVANASWAEDFPPGRQPTNHLYRNNRDGSFTDVTKASGLARSGWAQGVCAGDFDNDGYTDLFVSYYGHDVLYRNTGRGSFEDVTAAAGLATGPVRWGTGCAFLDYNLDGKLDLFVANYVNFDPATTPTPDSPDACRWKGQPVMCGPRGLEGGSNRLWRNDSQPGKPRFTDVSLESGVTAPGKRYSLSVTTLDYDRDGWPDIYVAVDSQASILYHNNRNGTFTDLGVEMGVAFGEDGREQAGMGTAAADFDGDGLQDLVKTNFIDDTPNLYKNLGESGFLDVTAPSGLGKYTQFLGWGVAFLDYDNDSWPDIFMVNGHVYPEARDAKFQQRRILYRNLGNGKFDDVSADSGPGVMAEASSRGLAIGDYDNDGDLDIFITNMNGTPSLLRNDGGNRRNFLNVQLLGRRANRDGIGARVSLFCAARNLIGEVRSGSTFLSHGDLRLHFGLGASTKVDRMEIDWPGGGRDIVGNIYANRFITVAQGEGIIRTETYHAGK